MISNIRTSPKPIRAHTNSGTQTSTQIGDFNNMGTEWYNSDSISNILVLSQVRKHCKVTMDTSIKHSLIIIHFSQNSAPKQREIN
jgi:hypothetical protein